jgi:hypothetical protein
METKTPISEAKRYFANAKEILSEKAGKDGNYYSDSKYVKMAGDTAWKGVLVALDAVFHVKKKTRQRVSIEDYQEAVAKKNRQVLKMVNEGYQILHISMGYDGVTTYKVCQAGMEEAKRIIDWCEENAAPLPNILLKTNEILLREKTTIWIK